MSDEEKAAKEAADKAAKEAADKAAEETEDETPEEEIIPVDFSTMGKDAFPAFLKEWNQFKKDVGWTPGRAPKSTFAKVLSGEEHRTSNGGKSLGLFQQLGKELEDFWGP